MPALDKAVLTGGRPNDNFTSRFFAFVFTRLTQWFANTANGIARLFVGEVHTNTLCVGETCVTEDEFRSLLTGAAAGAADVEGAEAPAAQPAQEANPDTDIPTSTTSSDAVPITSEPANGDDPQMNEPAQVDVEAPEAEAELPPANDNSAGAELAPTASH